MGRVAGKVAFITGAARGQGRSHALRLAEEGADIIAIDTTHQPSSVPYQLGTADELKETVRLVEATGRRIVAAEADVRDFDGLRAALDAGVRELGHLDIVSANAGVFSFGRLEAVTEDQWDELLDVNLKGVWHTIKAAVPHLRANGGGSIVITSSGAGTRPLPNIGHYVAAKHGVNGLMKSFALELAPELIRVNAVAPTSVDTPMIQNPTCYEVFAPDMPAEQRTRESIAARYEAHNVYPRPWIEPIDVSNAVLWLASEEARYVTGSVLAVDLGHTLK